MDSDEDSWVQIVVPKGFCPGDVIKQALEGGRRLEVTVPEGISPGQVFEALDEEGAAVRREAKAARDQEAHERAARAESRALEAGALKIQAVARGRMARAEVEMKIEEEDAALKIQAVARGRMARTAVEKKIDDEYAALLTDAAPAAWEVAAAAAPAPEPFIAPPRRSSLPVRMPPQPAAAPVGADRGPRSRSPARSQSPGRWAGGKQSIFDKLTDHSQYTGAHKHRFAPDGTGKGLAGRDRTTKGAGSLGHASIVLSGDAVQDVSQLFRPNLRIARTGIDCPKEEVLSPRGTRRQGGGAPPPAPPRDLPSRPRGRSPARTNPQTSSSPRRSSSAPRSNSRPRSVGRRDSIFDRLTDASLYTVSQRR